VLKNVVWVALLFYAILISIIWFTPISFAAIEINSFKSDLAWAVTNSGGKYYVIAITLITALVFALRNKINLHITIKFLKQFSILFVMLAFFALLNEFIIKDIAKYTRPSHAFVFEHATHSISIDNFYKLSISDRQKNLKQLIDSSSYLKESIDPKVLSHWVEEAGYSFPSGHTFNAFLLATVLAFSIKRSRKINLNKYYFVPFIWAVAIGVSRVALGAHAPIDVTFGGAMGIFFGALLLYFETSRNIILHRKH
jgi:phosphatidylglycerophosphatase B